MRADELYILQTTFFKRLDAKTGWGKEKVKEEFRQVVMETMMMEEGTNTLIPLIKEMEKLEQGLIDLKQKLASYQEG